MIYLLRMIKRRFKLQTIMIYLLLFSGVFSIHTFGRNVDLQHINGVDLYRGKKFMQSSVSSKILLFYTLDIKKTINLKKMITIYNSVLNKVVKNSQYKQIVEVVFVHSDDEKSKMAPFQLDIVNKGVVRIILTDDFTQLEKTEVRKNIFATLLLAKYGLLKKEWNIFEVPEWLLTGLEKQQRFYYKYKVNTESKSLIIRLFKNYPAMNSLVHSSGTLTISEIVDYPVPNEKYRAIYEAYSEACSLLLEIIKKNTTSKDGSIIRKILFSSLKRKKQNQSEVIYKELAKLVEKNIKKREKRVLNKRDAAGQVIINQDEDTKKMLQLTQLSLKEKKIYVDKWFMKILRKRFINSFQPYRYYEMDNVLDNFFMVDVEIFNDKNPVTSDIIVKKSTIKLEKLLYNLDKVNNITIVLNDLIAKIIKIKFKSSYFYQESFDKLLNFLQNLKEDEHYKEFDADKFAALISGSRKDIDKISAKAKKLDNLLSDIENEKVPPWYLYYFEFYDQNIFEATGSESKNVKKLLDSAEKLLKSKKINVKESSPSK